MAQASNTSTKSRAISATKVRFLRATSRGMDMGTDMEKVIAVQAALVVHFDL